jgi:hypothetical protein
MGEIRVQCQRTRYYIGPASRRAGGIWTCPHCPDGETYQQAEILDPDIPRLVNDAIQFARLTFGKADDGLPTRVWLGEGPETVYEADEGAVHIYLGRGSDWLQYAYSGSHEAFHRACSPCVGGSWADEMLAVEFSLRYLRAIGLEAHAGLNEGVLRASGAQHSVSEVVSGQLGWPDGAYGRAFLICEELNAALGRDVVQTLPSYCVLGGEPAFPAWRDSLSSEDRRKLDAIIGAPEGAAAISPSELAAQIWGNTQVDSRSHGARQIRRHARQLFPEAAPGRGKGWRLTPDQADAIRQRLNG